MHLPSDDAVPQLKSNGGEGFVPWELYLGFDDIHDYAVWPLLLGEFPIKIDCEMWVAPRLTRFLRSRAFRMLTSPWRGAQWVWDEVVRPNAGFILGCYTGTVIYRVIVHFY